ncbi:MAG: 50S ribosomal protein L35 [Planctomycetota bacterium]
MPKNKPHKGLLKRVRITKSGKVRHRSGYHKHLSSHKSAKRLRQLRHDTLVADGEAKRFEALLFRRLRGRTQPLASLRRSPSPAERRTKREAAAAEAQND